MVGDFWAILKLINLYKDTSNMAIWQKNITPFVSRFAK